MIEKGALIFFPIQPAPYYACLGIYLGNNLIYDIKRHEVRNLLGGNRRYIYLDNDNEIRKFDGRFIAV